MNSFKTHIFKKSFFAVRCTCKGGFFHKKTKQKKSSVLIQLSGWLRTLDMVRVAGLEPTAS